MMQFEHFPNIGYIRHKFPEKELIPIEQELANLDTLKPANGDLIGNIEREYHLTTSKQHVENLIKPLALAYIEHYGYNEPHAQFRMSTQELDLELGSVWVNLQAKNEFNPQHIHFGALTFVLYLHVPYSSADEKQDNSLTRPESQRWGDFSFSYANALGSICSHLLTIDNRDKGTCLVFPAQMNHQVYPFRYAKGLRISVSGNFWMVPKYPAVAD